MRFRLFTDETTSKSYLYHWETWPATSYADENHLVTRTARRSSMVDVVTPNFLRTRNKGGIICNPKCKEDLYADIIETSVEMRGKKDGYIVVRHDTHTPKLLDVPSLVPVVTGPDTFCMDQLALQFSRETDLAIQRAHADVDVSEIMLLASIGELPETLAYLANTVKRVVQVARSLRKRKEVAEILRRLRYGVSETTGKGQRSFIKQLERYQEILAQRKQRKKASLSEVSEYDALLNLWLEYRYAIRPLITDIQNAIKALSTQLKNARLVARGHEYRLGGSEYKLSATWDGYVGIYTFTADVKEDESVKARGGCLYALDAQIASFEAVFGLDQVVESAYELVPFSFIFDWAFSLGDLLQGLFKSSGLSVLTSWVSLEIIRSRSINVTSAQIVGKNGYSWSSQQWVLGSSHSTVKYGWRKPNPPFPLLPRLDIKLDLAKIIDLGAIGRNVLSGKSIPQVTRRN